MAERTPQVDGYIRKNKQWRDEFEALREIVLDLGLKEEIKWMSPCYTTEDGNIVIFQAFKEYCAIMFPKGALLDDPEHILIQMTENTQAARQIRFTGVEQVRELRPVIREYLENAIEIEAAGLQVDFKDTDEFEVPEEFQTRMDEDPALKEAFEALTPGRQRGYLLYFGGAKQSETRSRRVEQYIPKIMDGEGLRD
jgi:uncharacterized protein YdeI (YjbR/CyaY-like superfamily)